MKIDFAVSETHDAQLSDPSAVGFRPPLKLKRVRWREKVRAGHGQAIVGEFEHGGSRGSSVAVEVRVGFKAVIEDDMPVVPGSPAAGYGVGGEKKYLR